MAALFIFICGLSGYLHWSKTEKSFKKTRDARETLFIVLVHGLPWTIIPFILLQLVPNDLIIDTLSTLFIPIPDYNQFATTPPLTNYTKLPTPLEIIKTRQQNYDLLNSYRIIVSIIPSYIYWLFKSYNSTQVANLENKYIEHLKSKHSAITSLEKEIVMINLDDGFMYIGLLLDGFSFNSDGEISLITIKPIAVKYYNEEGDAEGKRPYPRTEDVPPVLIKYSKVYKIRKYSKKLSSSFEDEFYGKGYIRLNFLTELIDDVSEKIAAQVKKLGETLAQTQLEDLFTTIKKITEEETKFSNINESEFQSIMDKIKTEIAKQEDSDAIKESPHCETYKKLMNEIPNQIKLMEEDFKKS